MSTDKTLADVQPGGMVRLGDGPTIENQARELLAKEWETLSFDAPVEELREGCELPPVVAAGVRAIVAALSAHPFPDGQRDNSDLLAGLRDVEEHLYCAGSNPSHTETVRAAINALSAQPSPGGQDVLFIEELAELRRLVPSVNQKHALDAAIAALAARQPVGEPFGYCADFDPGAHEFSHTFYYLAPGEKVPEGCTPFFTKQPAQAVDLGQFRAQVAELLRREFDLEVADPGDHRHDDGSGEAGRIAGKIVALIDSQAVGNG